MTRYKCPKCKMEYDAPGKCDRCNVTLKKIEEEETHTNHDQDEHPEHKGHMHHNHADHHRQMVRDFKKRFIISALVTIPILLLSPLIQQLFNYRFGIPPEKNMFSLLFPVLYSSTAAGPS